MYVVLKYNIISRQCLKNQEYSVASDYLAGTADGKRPGKFYVNTGNLKGKPTYEAMALALHEGGMSR